MNHSADGQGRRRIARLEAEQQLRAEQLPEATRLVAEARKQDGP